MKAYIGSFPKHMLDLTLPFEKKKLLISLTWCISFSLWVASASLWVEPLICIKNKINQFQFPRPSQPPSAKGKIQHQKPVKPALAVRCSEIIYSYYTPGFLLQSINQCSLPHLAQKTFGISIRTLRTFLGVCSLSFRCLRCSPLMQTGCNMVFCRLYLIN